ncbi:MAG: 5-(carboxyamino)imidazole ribonucleotide synthase [Halofilum sp. (in: g-proteobacteria)]|nr:5-(carboxyamino)imidazole ribonucleotide synthase [Halofilum sp. (in: g-proteobacteria)]
MSTAPILPEAALGMLGGGQLGRMFTLAARAMGYRVVVLDPKADGPAAQVANRHIEAAYDDPDALDDLAMHCAAVSTEFENVPAASLERLVAHCPTRPYAGAVAPTQHRVAEKAFLDRNGLPTVAWAPVDDAASVAAAVEEVGTPALLKTASGGYDGKGQAPVDTPADAAAAFESLGGVACVLERRVALARELSVIVCRAADGRVACYPPGENVHVDGILATTRVPASVDERHAERAREIASRTAAALDYCGVLGVELFVTEDGAVLVNELAPRPHNSGHYTLDACATSQFEQQVRLLCGFGPGPTDLLAPVAMVNLLGDLWRDGPPDWARVLDEPGAKLHLYGKDHARPGRKMGHVNVLAADPDTALQSARAILTDLGGRPRAVGPASAIPAAGHWPLATGRSALGPRPSALGPWPSGPGPSH